VQREITETIVKTFLLAVTLICAFSSGAFAQTSNTGLAPRDPPFGKGNPGNDTMNEPNASGSLHGPSVQSIPREPPFGKGDAENDTMHLPSSATTRGMANDGSKMSNGAKKNAAAKNAVKKDDTN
jgi:hypothetical protein